MINPDDDDDDDDFISLVIRAESADILCQSWRSYVKVSAAETFQQTDTERQECKEPETRWEAHRQQGNKTESVLRITWRTWGPMRVRAHCLSDENSVWMNSVITWVVNFKLSCSKSWLDRCEGSELIKLYWSHGRNFCITPRRVHNMIILQRRLG